MPLHVAAMEGHAAVVEALLAAEVDKDAREGEVRGGGLQGESGAVRCGMGPRATCVPGVCVCV